MLLEGSNASKPTTQMPQKDTKSRKQCQREHRQMKKPTTIFIDEKTRRKKQPIQFFGIKYGHRWGVRTWRAPTIRVHKYEQNIRWAFSFGCWMESQVFITCQSIRFAMHQPKKCSGSFVYLPVCHCSPTGKMCTDCSVCVCVFVYVCSYGQRTCRLAITAEYCSDIRRFRSDQPAAKWTATDFLLLVVCFQLATFNHHNHRVHAAYIHAIWPRGNIPLISQCMAAAGGAEKVEKVFGSFLPLFAGLVWHLSLAYFHFTSLWFSHYHQTTTDAFEGFFSGAC